MVNLKITTALFTVLLLFSCSHKSETETLFSHADTLIEEYPDSALQSLDLSPEEIEGLPTKNAHAMRYYLHVPRTSASSLCYLATHC
jgi:hypothetical protein